MHSLSEETRMTSHSGTTTNTPTIGGADEQDPTAQKMKGRQAVTAAVVGNLLEWYDFAVYGYLAIILAKKFFPAGDEFTALLSTFAAFGVGFLVRPLGGIVIGRLGDTKGPHDYNFPDGCRNHADWVDPDLRKHRYSGAYIAGARTFDARLCSGGGMGRLNGIHC
jgi:hypothetical protein